MKSAKGFNNLISILPEATVPQINCSALFAANEVEIQKAFRLLEKSSKPLKNQTDQYFVNIDCSLFLQHRRYVLEQLSKEESNFPLAFSFVMYKDVAQFEQLLRAIYRPQNAYCIHVDLNADQVVHQAVQRLASCFPAKNVILASKSVPVKWGEYSVLEADLICFEELLNRFKTWKYLINLTGQEFPLKTHRELVRILRILNGANSIEGIYKRRERYRIPKEEFDFPFIWYKGSVHIVAARSFVNFMFTDSKALRIREVLKDKIVPDETFYSTLNHNPQLGAPGAYLGRSIETDQQTYHYIARFKNWGSHPCRSGRWSRQICIWGIRDLALLADASRFELFVNKFHWNYQRFALDCMEQRFWERSRRDYSQSESENVKLDIDEDFYRNLTIVRLHQ